MSKEISRLYPEDNRRAIVRRSNMPEIIDYLNDGTPLVRRTDLQHYENGRRQASHDQSPRGNKVLAVLAVTGLVGAGAYFGRDIIYEKPSVDDQRVAAASNYTVDPSKFQSQALGCVTTNDIAIPERALGVQYGVIGGGAYDMSSIPPEKFPVKVGGTMQFQVCSNDPSALRRDKQATNTYTFSLESMSFKRIENEQLQDGFKPSTYNYKPEDIVGAIPTDGTDQSDSSEVEASRFLSMVDSYRGQVINAADWTVQEAIKAQEDVLFAQMEEAIKDEYDDQAEAQGIDPAKIAFEMDDNYDPEYTNTINAKDMAGPFKINPDGTTLTVSITKHQEE